MKTFLSIFLGIIFLSTYAQDSLRGEYNLEYHKVMVKEVKIEVILWHTDASCDTTYISESYDQSGYQIIQKSEKKSKRRSIFKKLRTKIWVKTIEEFYITIDSTKLLSKDVIKYRKCNPYTTFSDYKYDNSGKLIRIDYYQKYKKTGSIHRWYKVITYNEKGLVETGIDYRVPDDEEPFVVGIWTYSYNYW